MKDGLRRKLNYEVHPAQLLRRFSPQASFNVSSLQHMEAIARSIIIFVSAKPLRARVEVVNQR